MIAYAGPRGSFQFAIIDWQPTKNEQASSDYGSLQHRDLLRISLEHLGNNDGTIAIAIPLNTRSSYTIATIIPIVLITSTIVTHVVQ